MRAKLHHQRNLYEQVMHQLKRKVGKLDFCTTFIGKIKRCTLIWFINSNTHEVLRGTLTTFLSKFYSQVRQDKNAYSKSYAEAVEEINTLKEKFRSMWGKWPKIARLLGNGRTAADWNRVKCYWRDTGQDRPWSCCDKCEQWRLREKGTVVVDGAYWTCADGGRKCTEPCDSVLPELVEAVLEAP